MITTFFYVLLMGMMSSVWAEIKINPDHPDTYIVQKGDTLWDIAGKFLSHPWQWPEIWKGNSQIENPDLIYPGDVIKLVYIEGMPSLSVNDEGMRGGVLKLSPKSREQDLERAIHTVPLDAIRQFLTENRVVTTKMLENAAYIVGSNGEHLIASNGDKIYVRGLEQDEANNGYAVYRKGKVYLNPNNPKDILGYEAIFIANAEYVAEDDGVSILRIEDAKKEVLKGDVVLLRTKDKLDSRFFPRPPNNQVEAHIIAVFGGVTQVSTYQSVILNLGADDGMKPGVVLDIYRTGKDVVDMSARKKGLSKNVHLPDERAGTLMVFKTFDRVSYALVMKATMAIHVMDKVKTPVLP